MAPPWKREEKRGLPEHDIDQYGERKRLYENAPLWVEVSEHIDPMECYYRGRDDQWHVLGVVYLGEFPVWERGVYFWSDEERASFQHDSFAAETMRIFAERLRHLMSIEWPSHPDS